jgi:hypothetical protein
LRCPALPLEAIGASMIRDERGIIEPIMTTGCCLDCNYIALKSQVSIRGYIIILSLTQRPLCLLSMKFYLPEIILMISFHKEDGSKTGVITLCAR